MPRTVGPGGVDPFGEGSAPLTPGARRRQQSVPGWCHTVLLLGISAHVPEGLEWVPEVGCRGAESTEATACHCLPLPRPLPKLVWFIFFLFSAVWFGKLGDGVPISRRFGSYFYSLELLLKNKRKNGVGSVIEGGGRGVAWAAWGRLVLLRPF